jgi:acyl-CoA hydrolase
MTQLLMPGHANAHGTAFGGVIMQLADQAAGMAVMRHGRLPVVTVSVDQFTFLVPAQIGQILILRGQVNAVFRSSMEVGVEVLTEDPRTGVQRRCCDAFLTMVAVGEGGRPVPVPPLAVASEEERRREREAGVRREARLALREALRR